MCESMHVASDYSYCLRHTFLVEAVALGDFRSLVLISLLTYHKISQTAADKCTDHRYCSWLFQRSTDEERSQHTKND